MAALLASLFMRRQCYFPDKQLRRVCRRTGARGSQRDSSNIDFERLSQSNREQRRWGWCKEITFLRNRVCMIAPLHRSDGRGHACGAMQDFMCRLMCHHGSPDEGVRAPRGHQCSTHTPQAQAISRVSGCDHEAVGPPIHGTAASSLTR